MPSLVAKKKGNKLYYYVVESARVEGKPRIVHQAYLGTAEKLAEMVRDRTAPIPLAATTREFGLPAALWTAAQQTGVWDLLQSLWPTPRSGPSPAHYLLLAALHRICQPGPKTEVAEWYRTSILSALWEFPAERFTSQAFWDAFEQILPEDQEALSGADDPLEQAQLRLLGLWKAKQRVSRRLLAYDTTNFYTYIASTNRRNQLAQRGHNKQGRHNLRQVGLSYVLDGEHGLSLCHHVYPGNVADGEEFSTSLVRITRMLDQNQMARETVTLVLDKGSAALANTVQLEEAGLGWISALPWNQAPAELRSRAVEELPACSSAQPGVRAAADKMLVHGREYLCVVKYSASFAGEQLHSLTTSLSRGLQALRRLTQELNKPKARWKPDQIERKIDEHLPDAITRVGEAKARQLLACLKFITDLERIGDLSYSAVMQLQSRREKLPTRDSQQLVEMASLLHGMLEQVHLGFEKREVSYARTVLQTDPEVDRICHALFQRHLAESGPSDGPKHFDILLTAQALERIGDHAKNLAEELFSLAEGRSLRHNARKLSST